MVAAFPRQDVACHRRRGGAARPRICVPGEIKAVWKTGRLAVLTIIIFSMMAELLSASGIADGLARGLFAALGRVRRACE